MAESQQPADAEVLPEAVVYRRRALSLIWLVPLVAALIGAWLIYKTVTETGPTVTISLRSAEGLQAGKTKIKFKDVEIGTVEEIRLSKDLSRVIVSARLVKSAEDYLREDTLFWVVRARVAATEVSGLSTLFSGAYIGLHPGSSANSAREFQGLDGEPVVQADTPGRMFVLKAQSLGSLHVGSPIFFRQIRVGQVVGYDFDPAGAGLVIKIFIEAPHEAQIRRRTRFWNASGFALSVDAAGLSFSAESLMTVLVGGIAFENPSGPGLGEPAAEGEEFLLYPNRQSVDQKIYTRKVPLRLYFDQSVRGLLPGAPVEFRGLRIGRVLDVNLDLDLQTKALRIPVLIEIEPERVRLRNGEDVEFSAVLEQLVGMGLRAQLKTGNLLTGQTLIDLDLHPDAPKRTLGEVDGFQVVPTLPAPMTELVTSLGSLSKKLDQLPYAELSSELRLTLEEFRATLAQTRQLVTGIDRELAPGATATLREAQKTLEQLQQLLDTEAPLSRETTQAMGELARAARSMRQLTDYLEQHPEALLRGR